MVSTLTRNSILALSSGDVELRPVVQILDLRQFGNPPSVQERYRLVLSDGTYLHPAMLATQLNEHVKSGQLQNGSIIQLLEYICNTVQQRKIVIVLNMEIIAPTSEIIGDPKQVISADQPVNISVPVTFQQHQSSMPAPPAHQLQQQQSYASMNNGGYKTGPVFGAQYVNGDYSKGETGVGGLGTGTYNSYMPAVLKPGQSAGGTSQTSSGTGKDLNSQASPYGRPVVAPSYQPSPVYSNRGPIAKNEAPARIIPISALNPYQGRWTIKARVTAKSDLRRFNNAKGDGKVFSFDLLDVERGEIRVTCFNNVAEQFFDRIDVGKVYLISKGSLKPSQRNFNHLKNEWEIFLESISTVECCFEEDDSIPHQQFDFIPISEIENKEGNAMVDVIGVIVAINPSNTIMRKNGTETQKRTLQLRDMSGRSVELTMWGAFCTREGQHLQDLCDSGQFPVLAVKAGRISDFSGKSVGTISTTQLLINPDLPQALEIRKWFDHEGRNTTSQSISQENSAATRIEMRKSVSQIKDEGLGRSDKPDWIAVKATISCIKTDNFCYTACLLPIGERQCNKKVTSNGDGTWRCDRCDKSIPECDYRYLLSLQVQDYTGVTWITAFQEAGEEIMGVSAKELYMWRRDENSRFGELIQKLHFSQHLFKLKVKEENYNDEQRVKCTLVKSEKLDYSSESRVLLDQIGKLSRRESIHEPGFSTPMGSLNVGYGGSSTGYGVGSFAGSAQGGTQGVAGFADGGSLYHGSSFGFGGGHGGNGNSSFYPEASACYKCGKGGHLSTNCPNGMARGQSGSCGGGSMNTANSCFKCGQGGHWARDCPNQSGGGGYSRDRSGYGGGY